MGTRSRIPALLAILMCIVGCQTEPKTTHDLVSETDIREKIGGTWTGDNSIGEHLTLRFDADGTVLIQRAGAPDVHAFWRTSGHGLIVTPEKDGTPRSSDDWWVVLHIDAHEFSFCRGPTTVPPLRFTRL